MSVLGRNVFFSRGFIPSDIVVIKSVFDLTVSGINDLLSFPKIIFSLLMMLISSLDFKLFISFIGILDFCLGLDEIVSILDRLVSTMGLICLCLDLLYSEMVMLFCILDLLFSSIGVL